MSVIDNGIFWHRQSEVKQNDTKYNKKLNIANTSKTKLTQINLNKPNKKLKGPK